jgi:hypothetical protein
MTSALAPPLVRSSRTALDVVAHIQIERVPLVRPV